MSSKDQETAGENLSFAYRARNSIIDIFQSPHKYVDKGEEDVLLPDVMRREINDLITAVQDLNPHPEVEDELHNLTRVLQYLGGDQANEQTTLKILAEQVEKMSDDKIREIARGLVRMKIGFIPDNAVSYGDSPEDADILKVNLKGLVFSSIELRLGLVAHILQGTVLRFEEGESLETVTTCPTQGVKHIDVQTVISN